MNENYHTLILNYQELINEIVRIQTSKEPMALLFNNLNLNQPFKTRLKVVNKEYKLLPIVNLTVYRVIQEACNNIIKHAQAKNVLITITYMKDELEVIIEDDGIGFDSEKSTRPRTDLSGFGVSIMKERVFLLSGNIYFYNKESGGTKIKLNVPVENNKLEK